MSFEFLLGPLGLSSFGGTVVLWLFVLVYFWFWLWVSFFVIWFVSVSFLCIVVLGVCVIAFVLGYTFPEEPWSDEHCTRHYYAKLYFHIYVQRGVYLNV